MSEKQMDSIQQIARDRAVEILGAEPDVFENPLTVLASPAWRGVETSIWRAGTAGRSVILKHYHPDISLYVDQSAAVSATKQAGELGVGPKLLNSWTSDSMLALEDLGDQWRAGGLQDSVDPDIRSKVIAHKKAFQAGAKLEKDIDIFTEIEKLYAITQAEDIFTHNDAAVFFDYFCDAKLKLKSLGQDKVSCHRDGNTANLMVGPDKSIQLLDFDLAGNCDPFEDVGCYMIEFFESESQARIGFEEWNGTFDEGLFQRSMIYGLADDMRWGLIGAIMAAMSPRTSLEFSKYSAWRFMRLEIQAKRSDANHRVLMAA